MALLLAFKPISAILNAILYLASIPAWLLLGPVGTGLWLLGVLHACFVINNTRADRRARQYGVC